VRIKIAHTFEGVVIVLVEPLFDNRGFISLAACKIPASGINRL
jgi:hypothetical protein